MPCINDYTDEEYNGTPVHKCRINKCDPYPCGGCAKDNKCYIEQSPAAVPHPEQLDEVIRLKEQFDGLIIKEKEPAPRRSCKGCKYTHGMWCEKKQRDDFNCYEPQEPTIAQFRADLLQFIEQHKGYLPPILRADELIDYITAYGRETHV